MKRLSVSLLVGALLILFSVAGVAAGAPAPAPGKKVVTWWSHWANEPAKRQAI